MRFISKLAIGAAFMAFSAASVQAGEIKEGYDEFEGGPELLAGEMFTGTGPMAPPVFGPSGASVALSFEGISLYDSIGLGRGFNPPDTMGAVGKTQYLEYVNGAVAVFNKATGARTALLSDTAFWAAAGQTGTNGDPRVLYNASAQRWIALSFGANLKDIQIAVSNTSDALGGWKSTKFQGFPGIADYPTLAIDNNAVYIGTNNFSNTPNCGQGAGQFCGTTLNVIPLASLFNAVAPTTAGIKQFRQDFTGAVSDGFALQGVNSTSGDPTGHILAVSAVDFALTRYNVTNAGTAGATLTLAQAGIGSTYDFNSLGRQPYTTGTGNPRVIDTLDDRVGASVWEVNGRIYAVHTITPTGDDFTKVRYTVLDAATHQVLDEGEIGDATHDYYEGSLAVNDKGQVVIAYNRSGTSILDGKISVLARVFRTLADGRLMQTSGEILLKVSDTDSYHNGSAFGLPASGRQRWGDYSAVSLDPTSPKNFWVIGEFAREFNSPQFGHPGGTGGARWGTFIANINAGAVPEPASWAMMILGFGVAGAAMRRRRTTVSFKTA